MAKLLQLRPKLKPFPEPSPTFPHFFSSSSSPGPDPPENPQTPSEPQQQPPASRPFSFSSIANNPQNPTSRAPSFEVLRKELAEFRRRTAPPSSSSSPLSFQELYKKNDFNNTNNVRPPPPSGKIDFQSIRANLRNLTPTNRNQSESGGKMVDSLSLSRFKDSFKLRPNTDEDAKLKGSGPMVIGGSDDHFRASIFGREIMKKVGGQDSMERGMRMEFVKMYSHSELGKKLTMLRPPGKKKEEFSLQELNERLLKLREIEEKESDSRIGGSVFRDLKESLVKIQSSEAEKSKKTIIQRLDVLGQLGVTPSFMLQPPKEQLVEKYFHPDNMSSEEKMKLELQKVRDEFKMSESDCGSSRVQVAQLTTKIKHLATVLHKKDKHSRKGLLAMVQKRKKLLKYLRRTDWDSYCLVLSKLGLRDNPDYKF